MGLYRSGTNFLQQTLDINFIDNQKIIEKHLADNLLYKHCLHDSWFNKMPADVKPIIVYKSPIKWIDSLVRQSYDLEKYYDVSFQNGHTKVELVFCDPEDESIKTIVACSIEKLCNLYNRYFEYWLSKEVNFISHKKIAFETEKYLLQIETKYKLLRKNKDFMFLKEDEVDGSRPFSTAVQKYYLSDDVDNLTSLQINSIQKNINKLILLKLEELQHDG